MKWLKSTTQKTWTVNGFLIPACVTAHNDYLIVEDAKFNEIAKVPVIASLIKAGGILVLSEEPAELKNSVTALQGNNAALTAQVTQLQEQLKQKEAELAASTAQPVDIEKIKEEAQAEIKKQAVQELEEKEARIAALEAQLAAKDE